LVDDFLTGKRTNLTFQIDRIIVDRELQAIQEGRRIHYAYSEGITFFRADARVAARNLVGNAVDAVARVSYKSKRHGGRGKQLTEVAGTNVTRLAETETQIGIYVPGQARLPGSRLARTAVIRGTGCQAQLHRVGHGSITQQGDGNF